MEGTSNRKLIWQTGEALLWGLLFILTPILLLILIAPLFVWREGVRTRRDGFLLGTIYRYPTIVLIVVLAAFAPVKFEDLKVGPLKNTSPTLGELAEAKVIYSLRYKENEATHVVLPSLRPSNREVMTEITKQNGFTADVYHCGDVANILFGSGSGRIRVNDWTNSSAK